MYATSAIAHRNESKLNQGLLSTVQTIQNKALVLTARSVAEANGIAHQYLHQEFPVDQGWKYDCASVEIPEHDKVLDTLIETAKRNIEQAQGFLNAQVNDEYWMGYKDGWESVLRFLKSQGISTETNP